MCRVDGGTFMFGGGTYRVNDGGTRDVHVDAVPTSLDAFFIDQFEVTAAQVALFLNAHGNVCEGLDAKNSPRNVTPCVWLDSYLSPIRKDGANYVVYPGKDHSAEHAFTWEGALRYCAWVGKTVPSSAQWEFAARHDPRTNRDYIYPWGDDWRDHAVSCNAKKCDARPVKRPSAPDLPPEPDDLPVGTFDGTRGRADGSSPWGLHDTAGGAAELVFQCATPERTCETGAPCPCRVLETSSVGAASVDLLRTDHRMDNSAWGTSVGGVRCVLLSD